MQLRADRVADEAAGAISANEVAATHGLGVAGVEAADLRRDAAAILLEPGKLAAELDADAREGAGVAAENLLQRVLRDPLGFFGVELVLDAETVHDVFEPGELRAVHAGGKHHVRRIVGRDRRSMAQRVGNAPAAEVLASADVGRLGTRAVADAVVALHDAAGNALAAEFDGQRQADRTRAGDEDVDGGSTHGGSP